MSFLSRAFTGGGESRDISSLFGYPAPFGVPTPAEDAAFGGGDLTPEGNAMALGSFYACVTLLADTIASLSINAYTQNGQVQRLIDPQPRLLQDSPYPELTWFDWLWMFMESLAITGNGFGYVTGRGPEGEVTGIMPVHPYVMNVEIPRNDGFPWPDPIYRVDGFRVRNEDVVHIKRYPIAGFALGMSPIQKAASAVGLGLAAERYGLHYFRDSANPSSVLESELPLTDDQVKQAQQQWISTNHGRRRPAIMSGGLKWRPISISPNESQFLETRQHQRSEIAMWFRIPPHMIGDTAKSTSWGTGIEQQSIGFVTYTLRPWLTCIEQVITALLPKGQFAKFNIDGLLRGDVKARWEAYTLGRNSGVYSVNDIRAMEDLPPIDDGDGRIQPLNFVPLGYEPPEPPQPAVSPTTHPITEPDQPAGDQGAPQEGNG